MVIVWLYCLHHHQGREVKYSMRLTTSHSHQISRKVRVNISKFRDQGRMNTLRGAHRDAQAGGYIAYPIFSTPMNRKGEMRKCHG